MIIVVVNIIIRIIYKYCGRPYYYYWYYYYHYYQVVSSIILLVDGRASAQLATMFITHHHLFS